MALQQISLRVDEKVVEHYRRSGPGFTREMARALTAYADAESVASLVERRLDERAEAAQKAVEDLNIALEFDSSADADFAVERINAIRQEASIEGEPDQEW